MSDPPRFPKITVVTPSYNQDRFLEECLVSVLGQGYPALEYIVIDGGSTDQSVRIIKAYEDRLTFWSSEPDGGQAAAINKGLQRSTGELVAWLNSDDYYLPGALARAARAYQENPGASFYFGDGFRVDEQGRKLGPFFPEGVVGFNHEALVFGLNYILQPATFINRSHLTPVGPIDEALRWGFDTDLWIRLSRISPPAPLPGLLAASREHATTKTATGSFLRAEELRSVAERHSGFGMTPGALCYFLDTLCRLASEREDTYPPAFRAEVQRLWLATSSLLARYGARPDGFPEVRGPEERGTVAAPPRSGSTLAKTLRALGLHRRP